VISLEVIRHFFKQYNSLLIISITKNTDVFSSLDITLIILKLTYWGAIELPIIFSATICPASNWLYYKLLDKVLLAFIFN